MDSEEIVLAALAPAEGKPHTPVQVQKLLFLIDQEAGELLGRHFKFKPYHYGPFDKGVYKVLEEIDKKGLITIRSDGWQRTYALTPTGQRKGSCLLSDLPKPAQEYIKEVSEFVRKLSFLELVSSIYQQYPDMRKNSVLRPS